MTSQTSYRQILPLPPDLPIFMSPAWLDCVCPGQWDVVYQKDSNGDLTSVLTFWKHNKWGVTRLIRPYLTPFCGLWFKHNQSSKLARNISKYHQVVTQLFAKLPHNSAIDIPLMPSPFPATAFHWAGCSLTTRYTYQLDISQPDQLVKNYKNTIRTDLQSADKKYSYHKQPDINKIVEKISRDKIYQGLLADHQWLQLQNQFPNQVFYRGVADHSGDLVSAALFVLDQRKIYYLLGTTDKKPKNNSLTYLLDQAFKEFSSVADLFDFEGSMISSVEPFFRRFGATPVSYVQLQKFPLWLQVAKRIKG